MPLEPTLKRYRVDSSSLVDCMEMLTALEKVRAACMRSSEHPSDHQGPSSASSAPALATSSSAPCESGQSIPAASAGPSTLSRSHPSS